MATDRFLQLTMTTWQEGSQFVSRCIELEVASCGDTRQEALANIKEAVELYLEDLLDLGDMERVLHEKGVQPFTTEEQATERVRLEDNVSSLRVCPASVGSCPIRTCALCSSRQLVSALERLGCYPGRVTRGSHQTYRRRLPDGRVVTTPVVLGRREIPKGTLKVILDSLQIEYDAFRSNLR